MSNPIITINLVVLSGEKYIRHCLDSVLAQTYPHEFIELNILDNGSTDGTIDFIENWKLETGNFKISFTKSNFNLGMWPGQEELLKHSAGEYVVILSVDVILDKNFISNSVKAMAKDKKIGALQAKIYRYDLEEIQNTKYLPRRQAGEILNTRIIDTCGFKIFRSRRVVNIGQGEKDEGQFNQEKEIFAVEGAVPVFSKTAMESCRIMNEIADHDIFWYAEDLDVAWRMRVLGWKQIFVPDVIAWHDRQTSKSNAGDGWWWSYVPRVKKRQEIPIKKRRLEWRNLRFTIIKNDYTINILKDLPHILWREIKVLGYTVIFEPRVLFEIPTFLRLLPKILRKRRKIMKRRVASPEEIRKWFI